MTVRTASQPHHRRRRSSAGRPVLRPATHAALTDIGLRREVNQDAFLATDRLWAVADGVGGGPGGEVAARIAIEALSRWGADRRRPGAARTGRRRRRARRQPGHARAARHGDDAYRGAADPARPRRRSCGRLAPLPAARRAARAADRGPRVRRPAGARGHHQRRSRGEPPAAQHVDARARPRPRCRLPAATCRSRARRPLPDLQRRADEDDRRRRDRGDSRRRTPRSRPRRSSSSARPTPRAVATTSRWCSGASRQRPALRLPLRLPQP